ncbi:MAG: hypothetical protein ACYSTF_01650, partial [Planctomycetota bacterium]
MFKKNWYLLSMPRLVFLVLFVFMSLTSSAAKADINDQVAQLDLETLHINNLITIFDELNEPNDPITFPKIDRRPDPATFCASRGSLASIPTYDLNEPSAFQVDLRSYDLSALDLSSSLDNLLYATFDSQTTWPLPEQMPPEFDWQYIMDLGKDPGLRVRDLHARCITGHNVGIAIIDKPLLTEHQEYADRLRLYEEINIESWRVADMHGAAVASIAVGQTVGVAPEADLYYIAAPSGYRLIPSDPNSFVYDWQYKTQAIQRVLEINEQLPDNQKIRVISISVGWSPGQIAYDDIMAACDQAKAAGMLIVSSSIEQVHGFKFHGLGRHPFADPDAFDLREPGLFYLLSYYSGAYRFSDRLLVPMDSRTTASPCGADEFAFYRNGGWSWAIPWIAGMYALAAQVDPAMTPDQFWPLAMETGRTIEIIHDDETIPFGPIVDPVALIDSILDTNTPAVQLNAEEIDFHASPNGPIPESQVLSISNCGSGTLNWVIDYDCNWLHVEPNVGSSTGQTDINTVTLTVTHLGLSPGLYNCELIVSDPCAWNSPQAIEVALWVGRELYVPARYPNIQAAIDDSNDWDTVIVSPGVYTGEGNRDLDFKGKAITVRSINPQNPGVVTATIINCQGSKLEPHRGFYFHNNEDANSVLAGITIARGYTSLLGGAICCHNASPAILNCLLVRNSAAMSGGGVSSQNGSNPSVTNSVFRQNSAGTGGGMYSASGCNPTLVNCTFSSNSATSWGGGLRNHTSSPTLFNCIFSGNSANYGGGIHNEDNSSNPTLINCTFSGNVAASSGGGIINAGPSPAASPVLTNCILWGNSDSGGTDESAQVHGGTPIVNYSCLQGWTGSLGGTGNIGADPCFADASNGDYHLKSEGWRWDTKSLPHWKHDFVTSRCIDAGNPGSPLGAELLTIVADPNHVWGQNLRINMGAYGGTAKASMPPYGWALLSDITNDGIVDGCDFACQAEDWLVNVAGRFGDLNR